MPPTIKALKQTSKAKKVRLQTLTGISKISEALRVFDGSLEREVCRSAGEGKMQESKILEKT